MFFNTRGRHYGWFLCLLLHFNHLHSLFRSFCKQIFNWRLWSIKWRERNHYLWLGCCCCRGFGHKIFHFFAIMFKNALKYFNEHWRNIFATTLGRIFTHFSIFLKSTQSSDWFCLHEMCQQHFKIFLDESFLQNCTKKKVFRERKSEVFYCPFLKKNEQNFFHLNISLI